METKQFDLGTVLTVTTGRLLTRSRGQDDNGIGDLYNILGWMTNDTPSTHQLGRFVKECKPWLLRWFPELAAVEHELSDLRKGIAAVKAAGHSGECGVESWLDRVQVDLGLKTAYDVPRIPTDDHDRKNPYFELVAERGTDKNIIVVRLWRT